MNQQRGAILVFFAIVLVVLLGFVALVIDTGIGESGRGEEQSAAQNASLAAMSAYLAVLKTPNPNPEAQQNTARERAKIQAERILGASDRLTRGFRQTPGADISLAASQGDGGTSGDGTITFGRMVWAFPTPIPGQQGSPTDDRQVCQDTTPCFIPFSAADSAQSATAVELTTQSNRNPLRTLFAGLLGFDAYPLSARAIATLIPQNYLFLVDLSMSMTDQSHRRIGARNLQCTNVNPPECTDSGWSGHPKCFKPGTAAYFAYELDASRLSDCTTNSIRGVEDPECKCVKYTDRDTCFLLARDSGGEEVFEAAQPPLGQPWSERRFAWRVFNGYSSTAGSGANRMNVKACRLEGSDMPLYSGQCGSDGDELCEGQYGDPLPALMTQGGSSYLLRRKDRYRVIQPYLGRDLITGAAQESGIAALADFASAPGSQTFAAQPEPLRSVLAATNSAMDFIGTRAVSADRFMLAGFDESIFASRSTCQNHSNSTTLSESLDCAAGDTLVSTSSQSFNDFLELTRTTRPGWSAYSPSDRNHFLNRWFYPRQGFNTDLQLALWKAYDELASANVSPNAKNLLFVVTDGLINCSFEKSETRADFTNLGEYLGNRTCEGSPALIGPKVIRSIAQLRRDQVRRLPGGAVKSLVQMFQEQKISVSAIVIGNNVRPHYIVRKSLNSAGGCMSNSEALFGGVQFVDWGRDRYCANQNCSTFRPELASDARAALTDPSGPVTLPISNLLYEELVAPTQGAWIPIMPVLRDLGGQAVNFSTQLQTACTSLTGTGTQVDTQSPRLLNGDVTVGGKTYRVTDGQGRLLFDPLGRSQQDQIIEQVRGVLGGGFVLVEPLMRAQ